MTAHPCVSDELHSLPAADAPVFGGRFRIVPPRFTGLEQKQKRDARFLACTAGAMIDRSSIGGWFRCCE